MSFAIKDDDVLDKYNEIWDKIKKTLSIKLHSMPVYDEKYIKAKVREFRGVIKTNSLSDEVPKCLYNYWFCYENGKEKLSAGLFRRIQIQNKKDKNDQIHRSLTRIAIRIRVRIWHWIRAKVRIRIWHWIIV